MIEAKRILRAIHKLEREKWLDDYVEDGRDPNVQDFLDIANTLGCRKKLPLTNSSARTIAIMTIERVCNDDPTRVIRERPAYRVARSLYREQGWLGTTNISISEACAMYAGYLGMAKTCRRTYHLGDGKYKKYDTKARRKVHAKLVKRAKANPWVKVGVLTLLDYSPAQDWITYWIPKNSPFKRVKELK